METWQSATLRYLQFRDETLRDRTAQRYWKNVEEINWDGILKFLASRGAPPINDAEALRLLRMARSSVGGEADGLRTGRRRTTTN